MKKITFSKALSILLGLAIMFSCVMGMQVSVAAEGTVALKVGEATVADGVVTVPVVVEEGSAGFQALTATVDYDSNILTLVKAEKVAITGVDDSAVFGPTDAETFKMQWAFALSETDVVPTGEIATLTFNVVEGVTAETANIDLEVTEAWDVAGAALATSATDGVVTFTKPCDHADSEWVVTKAQTRYETGLKNKVCSDCGEVLEENVVIPQSLRFAGGTLRLESSISVIFRVSTNYINTYGYENPYVVFAYEDVDGVAQTLEVHDYTINGSNIEFIFNKFLPQQMTKKVEATLYATYNGELYEGNLENGGLGVVTYGVTEYCKGTGTNFNTTEDNGDKLRKLIVDLLRYGDAMQNYMSYENVAGSFATDCLTPEQIATYGTDMTNFRALVPHTNIKFKEIASPAVAWKGASLRLEDSVVVRLTIETAEDLSDLDLVATIDGNTTTYKLQDFVIEPVSGYTNRYNVFFNKVAARQFSEPVQIAILKDGVEISNTVQYSVESYCAGQVGGTNANLVALVKAIMAYGDSAANLLG